MYFLLVDDHPLFREALRSIVQLGVPGVRVDEAGSIAAADARLARRPEIDLVVLDLSVDGAHGFDGLVGLRSRYPRAPILMCSAREEPHVVREALALGAAGFVPKSAPRVTYLEAFERVMAGGVYVPQAARAAGQRTEASAAMAGAQIAALTPAQRSVLGLIRLGKLNKQIAHELGIGESMVKAHVSGIMRKLGVRNRTQVALCATAQSFDHAGT